jgi:hypothetical protein
LTVFALPIALQKVLFQMNRRASGLTLKKALTGFLQYKVAKGLSPNTLVNREHHLKVFSDYVEAESFSIESPRQKRQRQSVDG